MKSERRKAGFIKMLLLVLTLAVFMPVSANALDIDLTINVSFISSL